MTHTFSGILLALSACDIRDPGDSADLRVGEQWPACLLGVLYAAVAGSYF